jgi:hypothetical protein
MPKITNAILNTEGKVDHYIILDSKIQHYVLHVYALYFMK